MSSQNNDIFKSWKNASLKQEWLYDDDDDNFIYSR